MDRLPKELIVAHVIKDLPALDLVNSCETLPQLKELCNTEDFWMPRVIEYYPDYVDYKPVDISWKVYFEQIARKQLLLKGYTIHFISSFKKENGKFLISRMNVYEFAERYRELALNWRKIAEIWFYLPTDITTD